MNKLVLSLPLFLYFLLLVPRVVLVHSKMITSCSQTPHPEICNSFVTTYNLPYTFEDYPFKFRDLILQITMDQAQQAHQQAISIMDVNSFTEQANYAWEDCLDLFEDTLHQLNRSVQHTITRKSMVDTQTWLSAATNNLRTCQNGFIEFNSSSHLDALPFMFRDISMLIGNSLAINKAAISSIKRATYQHGSHSQHFPSWVSLRNQNIVQSTILQADIIVAKDGKGHYRTITEAVAASEKIRRDYKRFVIYVKAGVYKENVEIQISMKNLMFIGDGMDKTIVTGNRNVHDGSTTFRSATFIVAGDGFIARGMTFENTAGPEKGQAVALRSDSDFSVFHECSFKGYQDTLYVHSRRQFYRNCDIYGTIDFIFGDAAAVFQNCNIYVRRPMHGQVNTVTAQGRNDANENTGIIIHNSRVVAAYDLKPVEKLFPTYLGRPWQKYSRTVYMKTYLGSLISPAGWLEWNDESALRTLYYGEYMNIGSGADYGSRVKWQGYHVIRDSFKARLFTPGHFFGGYSWIYWISGTGVPFTLGL